MLAIRQAGDRSRFDSTALGGRFTTHNALASDTDALTAASVFDSCAGDVAEDSQDNGTGRRVANGCDGV